MRKTDGDDASCLNLNRVSQPRILGLPSEALISRFSFVKQTEELNQGNPWPSLKQTLPGGVIPAIADQTVIQWGLGKKVGDTLVYRNEQGKDFTIKLIGGIANSIFQGNMLIDESHFLRQFPYSSGTHVFLAEGAPENPEEAKSVLERVFRNEGLDLSYTADRLATFNRIEDTYLSIFLLLGGLGMILGAVGLGITLARNILDRRKELAILKCMGYRTKTILGMLTGEHMFLLGVGTLSGAGAAVIATLPSILSDYVMASWQTALLIIVLIVANGLFWTLVIAISNLRKNLLNSLRTE
jgi:ABC-type antimicrobial peptide transport system permease subunit